MSTLQPLTTEEQEMAELYFYLIDEFLARKKLDASEYYDVAVFGYLEAIQRECRNPNPPENKNFVGLVRTCMKRAVQQEWRKMWREKRRGDLTGLSLDIGHTVSESEDRTLYDFVPIAKQDIQAQVEAADLAQRVLAVATPREREAIDLAFLGSGASEIAEILGIARNTANRIVCNFRVKAKAVRDDREVIRTPGWEKNKEKIRERNRAYHETHKEELAAKRNTPAVKRQRKERKRKYRAEHLEEVRAKERAYREAHREEINARARARRAAKRAENRSPMLCAGGD